ncbi:MAG: DinB family protein [Actinomycetes bacterium]
MSIQPRVLMVELVMSADRLIESARTATTVPGQWPPTIVLGHLCDNDRLNWSLRIDAMVTARRTQRPAPHFEWYEPEGDLTQTRYQNHSLDDVAAALMASRMSLVTQLRQLEPQDWQATAVHDIFGDIELTELIIRLLAHDEEHRASLVLDASLGGNL